MLNGTCEMFQELADSLGDPILSAFAEYMAAAYIQCGFRRAHESTVRTMPSTARPTPEESPLFTGSVLSDMPRDPNLDLPIRGGVAPDPPAPSTTTLTRPGLWLSATPNTGQRALALTQSTAKGAQSPQFAFVSTFSIPQNKLTTNERHNTGFRVLWGAWT